MFGIQNGRPNKADIIFWKPNDFRGTLYSRAFGVADYELDIPHSTVILKEYFENIPLKSCNIAKIFIKLLEMVLKYCRNLMNVVELR